MQKTFTRPGLCPKIRQTAIFSRATPPLLDMHTSLHFLFGPFSHKILDRPLPIFNSVTSTWRGQQNGLDVAGAGTADHCNCFYCLIRDCRSVTNIGPWHCLGDGSHNVEILTVVNNLPDLPDRSKWTKCSIR